jgi:glycosyltransferase involved in cell wall biosynthesis
MTPPMKLLHVSPRVRGQGGIESQLQRHAAWDAAHEVDSVQLALFDPASPSSVSEPAYATRSFSWRDTPAAMRRSMARALAEQAGRIVIWHNAWGLPWFGDVDGSTRRIVYLHANEAYFREWLPGLSEWIDGVVCDNPAAAKAMSRLLPELEPERVIGLIEPIAPPADLSLERPARKQWVIGCAGRLVREQKRWERLIPFVAELQRLEVPFRLEIVGEGPLRPWLERRLKGNVEAAFFGWLRGADYWRRLQSWDAALFFSDYEGIPIVLLEALAAGVIPIYPRIGGSLGDEYAPRVDPRCHYPAGDPAAAACALRDLLAEPAATLAELRRRARAVTAPNQISVPEKEVADFARMIASRPRRSCPPTGGRSPRFCDVLPLGIVTRAFPAALWR